MSYSRSIWLTIGALFLPIIAFGQGKFPPDTLSNLQVLPRSSGRFRV